MWNHIRGPPFVQKTSSGGVGYIHGSSHAQLILETYIIIVLSILLLLKHVLLAHFRWSKVLVNYTYPRLPYVLVLVFATVEEFKSVLAT